MPCSSSSPLTSSQNPIVYGQDVIFTATVSTVPPAATPAGTVAFLDGETVLGTVTLNGGTATLTTSALAAGNHNITARYSGGAPFAATTSAPLTQQVAQASLTVKADDAVKKCGEANPTFTAIYSGFVNGESEEALGGTLSFTTPATGDSPPGSYAVTPGGWNSTNYSIEFVSGTLTVAQSTIDRNSPEVRRQRARTYLSRGKLADALAEFDKVIQQEPNAPANLVERGQVHAADGSHDKAVSDFNQAIQAGVRSAEVFVARARSYAAKGVLTLAFADFDEALRLEPGNASVYLHRGQVHEDNKMNDRALADYSEAITLDSTQARFFCARGMVYHRKGESDLALADLIRALSLDPGSAEAYYGRGQVYGRKENPDQAVADYSEAIRLGLKSSRVYYDRGLAYARLHKAGPAIADFTRAINASPRDAKLYLMRGLVFSDKRDFDKAVADFTRAIQRDKKYTAAYQNRGRAYLESGKYGKAIKDLSQVIQFSPQRADAFDGRAQAYCLKKQYDEAIADASEAIRLNPGCASAYAHRSRAHAGKGNLEQAVADATEAIKLDARAEHYEARGLARYGRGEYDQAVADFTEAIKLAPKNGTLYRHRGQAYAQQGNTKKAEADRKKAKQLGASLGRQPKVSPPAAQTPARENEQLADATVGASIRTKALELLSAQPEGIRYAKLVRAIHDAFPDIPVNTIHGSVWDLDKILPEAVCKPSRGLFKLVKFRGTGAGEQLGRKIANSLGMRFALIPAGKFLMGSPESEGGRGDDEGPQHEVEIARPFYLGIHQVTQKQYKKLMGENPSCFTRANGGGASHPVEQVSWEEAVEFCRRLSVLPEEQAAGRTYRLPTEAEWEYACRGGANASSPFAFGDSLSSTQANFNGNNPYGGAATGPYLQRTTPVGSFEPNGFGLYDMHGNVWEWCADWFDEYYSSQSPQQDPQGPQGGSRRVLRGGGCFDDAHDCRSAVRDSAEPGSRGGHVGFRVMCVSARTAGD